MFLEYQKNAGSRPMSDASREVSGNEMPGGSETVLVVEDNELVLDLVVEMIRELGYHVLIARDGHKAMEIVRGEEPIDLLFTDVVMPNRMNGIELAREALLERPALKILTTSGYSTRATAETNSKNEFPSLAKPYRRAELAKRVRAILG